MGKRAMQEFGFQLYFFVDGTEPLQIKWCNNHMPLETEAFALFIHTFLNMIMYEHMYVYVHTYSQFNIPW